jgi:hypothetical protein
MVMISKNDVGDFWERGFLHIPAVFSEEEMDELEGHLAQLIGEWAVTEKGWTGPWRDVYMDSETEQKSKLTSLHDLQLYSAAWLRAVSKPEFVGAIAALIGPNVELHHSTLHSKPPESGHPFPMHQDNAFYAHTTNRYIDALIHLDDTCHENGEIRFLEQSHTEGALDHIVETAEGPCTPHLPTGEYRLEDTVPVPAKRGDVVLFNIFTVHGSYINTTAQARRMVRVGYRDPLNVQVAGQSLGRPGIMVHGVRSCMPRQKPYPTELFAAELAAT